MSEDILASKKNISFKGILRRVQYETIIRNKRLIYFGCFLSVLYIANGHRADNMIRESNKLSVEIKELQYEYKTVKSELMFKSREAEITKAVESSGLKIPDKTPQRIELLKYQQHAK